MNIVFRTDAALHIGSGHVMRCLTLAQTLHAAGHDCRFICREHAGHLIDFIRQQGFAVSVLPPGTALTTPTTPPHAAWLGASQAEDAAACIAILENQICHWLVVDHYALDAQWEQALRPHCRHIMAIDDLADRRHDCDLLLDQNLGRLPQDYAKHLPAACRLLIGTDYALLRPEFAQWRPASLRRRQQAGCLKQLLINLGGVDQDNHTGTVLAALAQAADRLPEYWQLTVVMGATAPHLAAVQQQAQSLPWPVDVRVNANNMAELMANADLAIGAAGSTAWERCCLGLPSIVLVLADNQRAIADQLHAAGAARQLDIHTAQFGRELAKVLQHTDAIAWAKCSRHAAALLDGEGVHRVAAALADVDTAPAVLRPLTEADVEQIWQWRNHPQIRRWMFHGDEIPLEQHWQWYRSQSHNADVHLCLFTRGAAQGFVHFRHLGSRVYEWGFYLSPDSPPGNGRHLGRAALDYAFSTLGAHKVSARVLAYNARSLALHQKLHFNQEGCLKNHHHDGTQYWDVIEFGLLAEHHQKNTHESDPYAD